MPPAGVLKCDLLSAEVTEYANGISTAEQVWLIETEAERGPGWVAAYAGLPIKGDIFTDGFESTTYLQCVSRKVNWSDAPDSRRLFRATCAYEVPGVIGGPTGHPGRDPNVTPTGLPWDEPAVIELVSRQTRELFLRDLDGKLVGSSSGEPFQPVPEKDRTDYSLFIVRNLAESRFALNETYRDKRNDSTFFGKPKGAWRTIIPGTVKRLFTPNGIKYYQETWEFSLDTNDYHQLKMYDFGMYKIEGGERVALEDQKGRQIVSPQLLDGSGGVLTWGDPPHVLFNTGADENRGFKQYDYASFILLGLPGSM